MILVTGGAGFVGSHVVDALLAAGREVRILDSLHPAVHRGRPDYVPREAELVIGDLRDAETVRRALEGVEHVSHQAGMVGLEPGFADAPAYAAHNDVGTAVLLAALAQRGFGGRLLLASSMVVYGEGRYECSEHGVVAAGPRAERDLRAGRFEPTCPVCAAQLRPLPVSEDATLDPRNVYAATKVHQEHLARAYERATGGPVTALRYHNVYGPRMPRDSSYAGVASFFLSSIAAGRPPRVFEDGAQLRDFVHVRDVARANLVALEAPEAISGAFNVCSGEPRSVGELASALVEAAADGAAAVRPWTATGEWRPGDVRHVFASADLAAERLGFRAVEDFGAGIAEFVQAPLRPAVGRAS